MKASLLTFLAGLNELRSYLELSQREVEFITTASPPPVGATTQAEALRIFLTEQRGQLTQKRVYIYRSSVVSLYGLLEKFVKSLIIGYVQLVNSIVPEFKDLPEAIAKNHTRLSLKLIESSGEAWYRGDIEQAEIVSNLNTCFSSKGGFRLNGEAFVYHLANMKVEQISSLLAQVGIDGHHWRIAVSPAFTAYLASKGPPGNGTGSSDEELRSIFVNEVDDIVERRNEIAHGTLTENILSTDILLDRIAFFEAYGQGLYEAVQIMTCPLELKHRNPIALGNPIRVINQEIVCFRNKDTWIKVGDKLIAETGNTKVPYRKGEVKRIEVDGNSYDTIFLEDGEAVALKIDARGKENYKFFLIKDD